MVRRPACVTQRLHRWPRDLEQLARPWRPDPELEQAVAEGELIAGRIAPEIAALDQHEHHPEDLSLRTTEPLRDRAGGHRPTFRGQQLDDFQALLQRRGGIGRPGGVLRLYGPRHALSLVVSLAKLDCIYEIGRAH